MAGKGKIDLNRASKEELMQIEGIGPATAEGIVHYREEHGGFKNIDELDKVGGIARTTLDKMKPSVEIGRARTARSESRRSSRDDIEEEG